MDFLSLLTRGEVGKKIEANKQNKVFEELVKIIKNVYTKKDEDEISRIIKKGNVREFLSKSFIEGLCYPKLKTVCIQPYMIENIINGQVNPTIIHEAIHLMRGIQNPHKFEKDITGFEEGATEYMSLKAGGILGKYGSKYLLNNKGQKMEYNIPHTCYSECTSIMAQLCIIFGEDKLQEFAFGENKDLLKNLQNTCGKDFYEHLRKTLNKYATDNSFQHQDILELQSELLKRCYTSKFTQVENVDVAAALFKELQDIDKIRAHFIGDTLFKDFYEEQYEKCIKKFGDDFERLEHLKYQEIEFLNVISRAEIKNRFNTSIKNFICDQNTNLETSLEYLNNTKRYIALYQDTLYQITIFKDISVGFQAGNEKEGVSSHKITKITNKNEEMCKLNKIPNMPNFNSDFYLKNNNDDNNQNYTLIIDGEQIPLTEIDLGVTKKDVESYHALRNSLNQEKTFKERFLNFFTKKKIKFLNAPENTDCTKEEKKKESFVDSIKTEYVNNNVDLPNKVDYDQIKATIKLDQENDEIQW